MKKLQIGLLMLLGTLIWVACEQPPGPYPPEEILIPIDIDDDPGDSNEFI